MQTREGERELERAMERGQDNRFIGIAVDS